MTRLFLMIRSTAHKFQAERSSSWASQGNGAAVRLCALHSRKQSVEPGTTYLSCGHFGDLKSALPPTQVACFAPAYWCAENVLVSKLAFLGRKVWAYLR